MTCCERRTTGPGWTACLGLLLATLLIAGTSKAEAQQPDHDARAAVIAQALRFVAWAPDAAPGRDLRVAVLGNTALGVALRDACANVQPGNRTVTVVDVASPRQLEAAKADVVVLGSMPAARASELVAALSRRGVVTMGDGHCPENRQVMLNLRASGSRYRVQANQQTAALAGVNLSARLLSLAHIVN